MLTVGMIDQDCNDAFTAGCACPHCEETGYIQINWFVPGFRPASELEELTPEQEGRLRFYVRCTECGMTGPEQPSIDAALDAWNVISKAVLG